jgi:ribonuclease P protein component
MRQLVILWRLSNLKCPRLGITVSTKVSPSAVIRNRIKRVIRETFRNLAQRFTSPLDLVIIARSGAAELTNTELREQLCAGFEKCRFFAAKR